MPKLLIFVGPTIRPEELKQLPDTAVVLPPVKHGDLFSPAIAADDTILIIDGLYHHTTSIRHKELLHRLRVGNRVIGAASIGALRAAELAPFGMIGVGAIYASYRDGHIDGDDEVAVAHTADSRYSPQNIAFVNFRTMLASAHRADVVNQDDVIALLACVRQIFYAERSLQAVLHACRDIGQAQFAGWLQAELRADPHFGDQKRADALRAINVGLKHHESTGSPLKSGTRGDVGRDWETVFFREWRASFAEESAPGSTLRPLDRIWFQQLFNPRFGQIWGEFLANRSESPRAEGTPEPLLSRLASLGDVARHSVSPTALYKPRMSVWEPEVQRQLLAGETQAHRETISAYLADDAAFRLQNTSVAPSWLRAEIADRLLAELWGVAECSLETEATSRGLRSIEGARRALHRFLIGYLNASQRSNGHASNVVAS